MNATMQTMTQTTSPLNAQDYWSADQLRVMRGLELPTWFRPVLHESVALTEPVVESTHPPPLPTESRGLESSSIESERMERSDSQAVQAPLASTIVSTQIVYTHYPWLVIADEAMDADAEKLWLNMLASVGKTSDSAFVMPLSAAGLSIKDPFSGAAQAALAHIQAQLVLMQPKLIIAMGVLSAQVLLAVESDLTAMQGELHEFEGLPLLVTQHPAMLLANPALKAQAWQDMNLI